MSPEIPEYNLSGVFIRCVYSRAWERQLELVSGVSHLNSQGLCVFGSLPIERRRSKDDHTGYVPQTSHGLCTILMICVPRRLAGAIRARILAIVSLRVCSGPQRVSDQAEILTEPSIFEISPYSIILGQPTSYTHIRRSLRTSSPPHTHHQSDSVYRNGNQSFPPRAEQYDSTFLIFKVTFAVPAP